jgi:imidazolonepropionase-like amidohydrolase
MLAIRVKQVFDGRRVTAGAGVVFVDDGRIVGVESTTADIPRGCRVLDRVADRQRSRERDGIP